MKRLQKLIFLSLFFAFSNIVFSIEFPDLNAPILETSPDFVKLEHDLAGEVIQLGLPNARGKVYELAKKYLKFHRVQEAIWTLRRGHYFDEADSLEKKLEDFLLTAPEGLVIPNPEIGNKKNVFQMAFCPGVSGIVKWWQSSNPPDSRMEIVAYDLDKLLKFDRVPVTVKRTIRKSNASVQYFVQDSSGAFLDLVDANELKQPDTFRIHTLDLILGNTDRNGRNWRYRPGKWPVAIDHSQSSPTRQIRNALTKGVDDSELAEIAVRLGRVAESEFRRVLSQHLRKEEIDGMWNRFENVKSWYRKNGFSVESSSSPTHGAANGNCNLPFGKIGNG